MMRSVKACMPYIRHRARLISSLGLGIVLTAKKTLRIQHQFPKAFTPMHSMCSGRFMSSSSGLNSQPPVEAKTPDQPVKPRFFLKRQRILHPDLSQNPLNVEITKKLNNLSPKSPKVLPEHQEEVSNRQNDELKNQDVLLKPHKETSNLQTEELKSPKRTPKPRKEKPKAQRVEPMIATAQFSPKPAKINYKNEDDGVFRVRLNRCLRPLSRKLADSAILEGQVTVNGAIAMVGAYVARDDVVTLAGLPIDITAPHHNQVFGPFDLHRIRIQGQNTYLPRPDQSEDKVPIYIKMWKPKGYTSTLLKKSPHNLIELLNRDLSAEAIKRLYCVGELAPYSSGVIILTNDRRLVDSVKAMKVPVECLYAVAKDVGTTQIEQVESDSEKEVLEGDHGELLESFNGEGEIMDVSDNESKYVVKMVERGRVSHRAALKAHLGGNITSIMRTSFAGIGVDSLPEPGFSQYLTHEELKSIMNLIHTPSLEVPATEANTVQQVEISNVN